MDMPMPQGPEAEAGGASVTIDKTAEGFTVSANPGEPKPVASLDEALSMAGQILSGEGGEDPALAEQAMAAGFNQVRGGGLGA
jgi:hypothetical protein